jgi:hypothetical protein
MADDSASTDVPRRSAIEPRAPMPFSLPGTQIRAHFGPHRLDRHDIDTINRGIHPQDAPRFGFEGGSLPLRLTTLPGTSSFPVGRRLLGRRSLRQGLPAGQGRPVRLPAPLAFGDWRSHRPRRLAAARTRLLLPAQAVPHLFGADLNAPMAPGRQPPRVSFAGEEARMRAGPAPPLSSRIVLGNCTFISVSALCLGCTQRPASFTCRSRSPPRAPAADRFRRQKATPPPTLRVQAEPPLTFRHLALSQVLGPARLHPVEPHLGYMYFTAEGAASPPRETRTQKITPALPEGCRGPVQWCLRFRTQRHHLQLR